MLTLAVVLAIGFFATTLYYRKHAILREKTVIELTRRLSGYREKAYTEADLKKLHELNERYYKQQLAAEQRAHAEANNAHRVQQMMSNEIRRLVQLAKAQKVELRPSPHIESALREHEEETGRDASLGGWSAPA